MPNVREIRAAEAARHAEQREMADGIRELRAGFAALRRDLAKLIKQVAQATAEDEK